MLIIANWNAEIFMISELYTNLIAGSATGFQGFGMMTSTIEPAVSIKVDQINEQFSADAAAETARMPTVGWPGSGSHDGHITASHRFRALCRSKYQISDVYPKCRRRRRRRDEGEKQVSFYIYIYPFFDFFFCHEKWK